jgi:hypothetical protein
LLIVARWMLRLEESALPGINDLDAATRAKAEQDLPLSAT